VRWKNIHIHLWQSDTITAEVVSNIVSYSVLALCATCSAGALIAATLVAEYVAFYGVLALRRYARYPFGAGGARGTRMRRMQAVVLSLATEYGGAECLDAFLLRPVFLAGAVAVFPREPVIALLLGGLCTDLLFHACAWMMRHARTAIVRARVA
jgi:hypothetical protein